MPGHGGKREGAGRPPGSLNKRTREIAEAALQSGQSPLEFALQVMRDEGRDIRIRLEACKAAMPHMHPRLAAVEHSDADEGRMVVIISGRDADI